MSENPSHKEPRDSDSSPGARSHEPNSDPPDNSDLIAEPLISPELLDRLSPQEQAEITGFVSSNSAWMRWSGMAPNSIQFRFGPQPTPEIFELASRTVEAEISDRKHSRLFGFLSLALLVVASLALMLVLALINENDLLLEIVKLGGVGLGGFGGGYGFSALRRRN